MVLTSLNAFGWPRLDELPHVSSKGSLFRSKPVIIMRDHSLSTYAKFPEKLTFLASWYAHVRTRAYQGLRNVSFSENFAYVLSGWSLRTEDELHKDLASCFQFSHSQILSFLFWWFSSKFCRVFVQNTASLPPFRVRAYHFSVSSLKIMQSYMREELLRMQFSMSRRRLKQGFFKVHFYHFCKSHILLHQIFSILK